MVNFEKRMSKEGFHPFFKQTIAREGVSLIQWIRMVRILSWGEMYKMNCIHFRSIKINKTSHHLHKTSKYGILMLLLKTIFKCSSLVQSIYQFWFWFIENPYNKHKSERFPIQWCSMDLNRSIFHPSSPI